MSLKYLEFIATKSFYYTNLLSRILLQHPVSTIVIPPQSWQLIPPIHPPPPPPPDEEDLIIMKANLDDKSSDMLIELLLGPTPKPV